MRAFSLPILTVLVIGGGIVVGQEQGKIVVDSDGHIVVTPEMEAYVRRRRELLETPGALSFKIVPKVDKQSGDKRSGENNDQDTQFKSGAQMSFEVSMTNMLDEPIKISIPDAYEMYRLQLFKAGELLSYSDKVTKTLEDRKRLREATSLRGATLNPNDVLPLGFINLKNWYGPLDPGMYQLLIQYRPSGGVKWLELPPVNFEVVP